MWAVHSFWGWWGWGLGMALTAVDTAGATWQSGGCCCPNPGGRTCSSAGGNTAGCRISRRGGGHWRSCRSRGWSSCWGWPAGRRESRWCSQSLQEKERDLKHLCPAGVWYTFPNHVGPNRLDRLSKETLALIDTRHPGTQYMLSIWMILNFPLPYLYSKPPDNVIWRRII